jgi:tRNA (guanine37-N1)-methyltransferase
VRATIVTLFPRFFEGFLAEGILGRAVRDGKLDVRLVQLRDFARGRHRQADDYPYGGGEGMLLKPEPLVRAIRRARGRDGRVILLSARGRSFDPPTARRLSRERHIVLVCGHYEGVDARVERWVDEEICVGDYVLSGGEIAAMAVLDAAARFVPGVLGNRRSVEVETFSGDRVEYDQYTRPRSYRGRNVPGVLLSGDHGRVDAWRRESAAFETFRRRPALFLRTPVAEDELRSIADRLVRRGR